MSAFALGSWIPWQAETAIRETLSYLRQWVWHRTIKLLRSSQTWKFLRQCRSVMERRCHGWLQPSREGMKCCLRNPEWWQSYRKRWRPDKLQTSYTSRLCLPKRLKARRFLPMCPGLKDCVASLSRDLRHSCCIYVSVLNTSWALSIGTFMYSAIFVKFWWIILHSPLFVLFTLWGF